MKKPTIKKLQQTLWGLCRDIIRERYKKRDGTWSCYTCGVSIEPGHNMQLGHFIPSSVGGALLRYHLENLRWQCFRCNIHGGGMGAMFYKHLLEEKGQEVVDRLFKLKQETVKADVLFYNKKIDEYKAILGAGDNSLA